MDRALITQLQSMNASQRKEAIMALGRGKDREAIPYLSRVAETDPDDELRELARKAALYVDKNAPNVKPFKMPWDDEQSPPPDEDDGKPHMTASETAALSDYHAPTSEEVTEKQDREWADRFIERAWQAYYLEDKQGAENFLRKAFERSPQIAENDSAREAAGKIMGMNPDRAVSALLKPKTMRRGSKPDSLSRKPPSASTRPATLSVKPVAAPAAAVKGEKSIDEIEDGTFSTLLLDLFVFFVIVFILNFIAVMLVSRLLVGQLSGYTPDPGMAAFSTSIIDVLQGSTGDSLVYSVLSALGTLLETLFLWVIIHLVATTLVGGNSTFPRLVRKTYLYFALFTPVIATLAVVGIGLSAALDEPTLLQTLLAAVIFGSVFLFAWRIGTAYRFDIARGCFTMILTTVAFVCCGITVSLALMAANVGPFAGLLEQINGAS